MFYPAASLPAKVILTMGRDDIPPYYPIRCLPCKNYCHAVRPAPGSSWRSKISLK